jgi:16S rRNA (cytidine1402-2'-O)-methyltransferase
LLAGLADQRRTLVAFESAHRLAASLEDIELELGNRHIAIARELTKLHEEIWRGSIRQARVHFAGDVRGEITLVITGASAPPPWDKQRVQDQMFRLMKQGLSHREAAKSVSKISGWSRRDVYQLTLNVKSTGEKANDERSECL